MLFTVIAVSALVLAVVPAILYCINCRLYRPPPPPSATSVPVSILIPARNEEANITAAIESALNSRGVDLEVVIFDDDSSDRTADVVLDLAKRDPRVRLVRGELLPADWCGKQFACQQLAGKASHQILVFTDADVRLAPEALVRLAVFLNESGAALVSGIPRQETGSFSEALVIPLIHFLLLGYLPFVGMRLTRWPTFGAACGQLIVTRREAYEAAGGHAAIRASRHDGITLPRAYRRRGLSTDLCDVTGQATCRMYRGLGELWFGLAKNAREGLAHPVAIVPWSMLLFGGQILPWILLAWLPRLTSMETECVAAAVACSLLIRVHAAICFRQSWLGALLHPFGVTVLLAIQWYAAIRAVGVGPVAWKGRIPASG
jgi:glycosyltransferase involved in cell wall biosynthesis